MEYITIKYHRKNSAEALLSDLRRTAKKLKKKQLTMEEYDKAGKYSASGISKRFGGWNNALLKAGLKIKKINRITNDELLENINCVWDTLGRQPSSTEMAKPLSRYNRIAYKRRFGTWYKALMEFTKALRAGKIKPPKNSNNRMAKQVPAMRQSVNKSMRFDVFKRDKFRCRICGASPANDIKVTLQVDHIVPAFKGGETELSNLQTLCSDCNYGKGAKAISN